ncbi:uncharacterized protein UBRO_07107 [Ustilago bromivora]|uniref:Uncharacterized protein n=1 Tax=Ustilago bromivora TaxID=307758 RepID=A0A1K0GCG5_9BASI|nr:uncharacterized protein UBRO_07107 [Ustilago bromivora]SYW76766.1 uncharacterized protein UBRO2_01602 [Ustilago bromivora]
MKSLGRLSITIALLGLIVFLTSTTKANDIPFERRIRDSSYDHQSGTISYQDLEAGGFRPDPVLRGITSEQHRKQFYPSTPFHEGVPIFFSGQEGYRLRSLQRAYADYSTVHLSGRHDLGEDSLTIYKTQLGQPQVVKASPEVHEYSRQAFAARKTFGETAAIVAYGHKLRAIQGSSGRLNRRTPGWEKVWNSHVEQNAITVEEARVLLEKNRHLKFKTADDRAILGIRLHPDGKLEQKWLSSLEPVFHF